MLFHPQTSSHLLSQLFVTHLGVALLFFFRPPPHQVQAATGAPISHVPQAPFAAPGYQFSVPPPGYAHPQGTAPGKELCRNGFEH